MNQLVCVSEFIPYQATSDGDAIATVTKTSYNASCSTYINPVLVSIKVFNGKPESGSNTYQISIDNFGYSVILSNTTDLANIIGRITDVKGPINVIFPLGPKYSNGLHGVQNSQCNISLPKAAITRVQLIVNVFYEINMLACNNGNYYNVQINIIETIKPMLTTSLSSAQTDDNNIEVPKFAKSLILSQTQCNNIRVPIIIITAQTTIDGSDLGQVIFMIEDQFKYDERVSINNKCGIYYLNRDQIQQTIFDQCCPFMVSVVKGKGFTLYEKLINIFQTITDITFLNFYENIILYGMAKYILSRLLYGHFDINYLLGKYNDKFLHDLGISRFCGFLQVFNDCNSVIYNYNKYFKYNINIVK